jgi:hypothetical protein
MVPILVVSLVTYSSGFMIFTKLSMPFSVRLEPNVLSHCKAVFKDLSYEFL